MADGIRGRVANEDIFQWPFFREKAMVRDIEKERECNKLLSDFEGGKKES